VNTSPGKNRAQRREGGKSGTVPQRVRFSNEFTGAGKISGAPKGDFVARGRGRLSEPSASVERFSALNQQSHVRAHAVARDVLQRSSKCRAGGRLGEESLEPVRKPGTGRWIVTSGHDDKAEARSALILRESGTSRCRHISTSMTPPAFVFWHRARRSRSTTHADTPRTFRTPSCHAAGLLFSKIL